MEITKICLICNIKFKPQRKNRPQKYCSWQCKAKGQIGRKQPYQGKKYFLNCVVCGKIYQTQPYRIKTHKYCSWDCKKKSAKGTYFHSEGYILVKCPNHPFADVDGYILQHRIVVENFIGRYLTPGETIHHLGNKNDNRPQKLMCFKNHSAHMRFHHNPDNVKPSEIIFDGRLL